MIRLPDIIWINDRQEFVIEDWDLPKLKKWLIEYEMNEP